MDYRIFDDIYGVEWGGGGVGGEGVGGGGGTLHTCIIISYNVWAAL